MRAFGSFRKSQPMLPPNSVEPIPGARGPVTSRQAAACVRAAAADISPHTLHLVQSGRSILPDGRSHTWEFMLRFPDLGCSGLLSVQPNDPDGDPDSPTLGLWREFLPLSDDAATPPSLAWSFSDSPDVVAALTRAGANLVAGPTSIASTFDGEDVLHWWTDCGGEVIRVPDADGGPTPNASAPAEPDD